MEVPSARLRLIPFAPAQILALQEGAAAFEAAAGLRAADGLRAFMVSDEVSPAWLAQLRAATGSDPWIYGFAVVEAETNTVIGTASFKGPPDPAGIVEIAYGVVPAAVNRGYATEAARALVAFAWRDPRVRCIRAHTLPVPNASTRVLAKCGFACKGEVDDPEDGRVWRWERDQPG